MNIYVPTDDAPGEARSPGPSTAEIVSRDALQPPKELLAESYEFLGDEDIPFERYVTRDFFQQEVDKMWNKVWQWACRLEHIPEVGDNYVYDVGPYSILVVRHGEGPEDIKAYHNSCLHRGTQLKPSHSTGNSPALRCPFHGWEWNLDGTVNEIPCRWDFPKVTDDDFQLPAVQVGFWGGFVFINMDPDCEPLEDYLEVLPKHFANWPLDERYAVTHVQKTLPANWKASQEAFIEAYHSMETHHQAMPFSANLNAKYDVFGRHVSRFHHTFGVPDPSWQKPMTEQEVLDATGMVPEGTVLPEGMTARAFLAQYNREALSEELGMDMSKYSDAEMMDSIEYHLFPNMFLFPGITLPMIYRFRPNGMDPDSSIFDLVFLRLKQPGEEVPEAPEPYKVDIGDSYADAPGVGDFLGPVYDQDTGNLEMQQRGFKAAVAAGVKTGQTLGNYQEIRLRRFHMTLDQYLSA
ncbi:MAG: aromatic ring-hydroxylating oxygenase subunit alpha [Alphaproteobacteria bacterium]